jgi:hypothetical protein
MKTLSIKYDFDEEIGVYIISQSEVIGIHLWDRNLDNLVDQVTHCAPTYIRLNHPELQRTDTVELSFQDRDGRGNAIVRQISLTPQDPKPAGLNGLSRSAAFHSC